MGKKTGYFFFGKCVSFFYLYQRRCDGENDLDASNSQKILCNIPCSAERGHTVSSFEADEPNAFM